MSDKVSARPQGVQAWLEEVVAYGGLRVRRVDMEHHLDALGVTGPARLRYALLEPVDGEVQQVWSGDAWEDV